MIEANRHIISTIKWDSTFDKKQDSSRLQDRLSDWSKYSLPTQVDGVFNHISSPYITWQIDKLTIDLGTIFLDDLEHDLSVRVKKELSEKLSELLVNAKQSDKNIKVVHRNISINNLLEYYFKKGSMPWNFNQSYGSINDILAYQLAQNTREVVYLFRHLAKDLNVRKRIAWQVNEENQKQLINHLEPYYHTFITDTLSEIIEIQNKLKIAPAHISVFKKYLNVWVFNYLFLRTNIVFSKEGFIANVISQMALWFGFEKDFLNDSIHQNAKVLKLENISTFGSNIVFGLPEFTTSDLVKSDGIGQNEYEVSWVQLEKYLLIPSIQKKPSDLAEYNELVTRLYFHNPVRFAKLISSLDKKTNFWSDAIVGASHQSFEVFINVLAPVRANEILGIVNFLNSNWKNNYNNNDTRDLWLSTLEILSGSKNQHIDKHDFLIDILSVPRNMERFEKTLDFFDSSQFSSAEKNIPSIDIHSQIRDIRSREKAQVDGALAFLEIDSVALVESLFELLSVGSLGGAKFVTNQKKFARNVQLNPYSIFSALADQADNPKLVTLLPLIFDEFLAGFILRICRPNLFGLLVTIQEGINEKLDSNQQTNKSLLTSVSSELMVLGVKVAVSNSNLSNNRFLELILKEIKGQSCPSYESILQIIELDILNNDNLKAHEIDEDSIIELKRRLKEEHQDVSKEEIIKLMTSSSNNKLEVVNMLQILLFGDHIIHPRFPEGEFAKRILNYLFVSEVSVNLVEKHISEITVASNIDLSSKIKMLLHELFWISVIDYSHHLGDVSKFKSLIEKSIKYNISILKNRKIQVESDQSTAHGTDSFEQYQDEERLEELLYQLIITNRVPSWYYQESYLEHRLLTKQVIDFSPRTLLRVLKKHSIPDSRLSTLCSIVPFKEMIVKIYTLHPLQQSQLIILSDFHSVLDHVDIKGISSKELKTVIYKKVLVAWSSGRWGMLSSHKIWKEIMWDVCVQRNIETDTFLKVMDMNKVLFPSNLKLGLNLLVNSKNDIAIVTEELITKSSILERKMTEIMEEDVLVRNAGLVLINSYLPMLFNRLGLTKDNKFVNDQAQLDAVHYVQFLVTGHSKTDEMYLPLNKILCGLDQTTPIFDGITITEDQKSLMEGLISAAIAHWPVIGETSIDGFRGNWLVRDGMLQEGEDKWELRVEKRAYDVLIGRSPFSFSIIKFPWMNKPIHVTWPY